MEAKELKKLSRSELLEMLLDRSKEVEHLRKELDESKKHIATLEREVAESGDINDAIKRLENGDLGKESIMKRIKMHND